MTPDARKLIVYFGERTRRSDALMAAHAERGLRSSVLLRGALGFGLEHHLRTDRLLTLSEDLPLVAVAVDAPAAIAEAAEEAAALVPAGLVTLEPAWTTAAAPGDELKLTVFLGRRRRDHVALVALLHRHGLAGASVFAGVDGAAHGRRRRARLIGANGHVPLIVVAFGARERVAAALAEIEEPARIVEAVRVCKRDGARLAVPGDGDGRLTVVCGEQSRSGGQPLAEALVRALRREGAAGATAVRGVWGFHGDHAPHGDALLQLRRRVPVLVTVVDAPERIRRWFDVVDRLTAADGLVLAEPVTALPRR